VHIDLFLEKSKKYLTNWKKSDKFYKFLHLKKGGFFISFNPLKLLIFGCFVRGKCLQLINWFGREGKGLRARPQHLLLQGLLKKEESVYESIPPLPKNLIPPFGRLPE
jgi:hypothetical protein